VNIGITYDLRADYLQQGLSEEETAEFDVPETIDGIASALEALGHATVRIGGIRQLVARLAQGETWDLVFNYAEGLYGLGREAQVPAVLDAFQIPYTFSDTCVMSLALDKALTKRVVRDLGIATPSFAVLRDESDLAGLSLPFPLFAKPVGGGSSIGISAASRVTTTAELTRVFLDLSRRFQQPVLVESFLPGRDLTVGIIGSGETARAIGVLEVVLAERAEPYAYSYKNKQDWVGKVRYQMASDAAAAEAADMALRIWKALGARDAGRLDFRCDETGRPNFLELNPLAGLHEVSDLIVLADWVGSSRDALIEEIVSSAVRRMTPRQREALRR
jgi:D-alanine-D-alanine ligase